MLQFSLSLDSSLLVRDDQRHYLPGTADQILYAVRDVIYQNILCTGRNSYCWLVKDYYPTKQTSFEREVFTVLFLKSLTSPAFVA